MVWKLSRTIIIIIIIIIIRKCTGLETYQIARKGQWSDGQGQYQTVCQKWKKELQTLIQTARICSSDMGLEFDIETCAMLIMRKGKRHMTKRIELSNQKKSEFSEKGNLKILGNTWSGHHQTSRGERKK